MLTKKPFSKKPEFSSLAVWIISLYTLYAATCIREPRVSSWDVLGYYAYLPQTFIEHDAGNHHLTAIEKARTQYNLAPSLYQFHQVKNGNHLSQYPMGMSCFYLPGFLTGHAIAYLAGYPADGYSPPYQYSQVYFNVLYCLISFWLLRKLLRRYFTDGVSALLLLLFFLGTNYYLYATIGYGMPHTYLFMAYVLVIWLTLQWHEQANYKNSLALGGILGLMAICRPTEILALLIPLFWQVHSWGSFKHKLQLVFKQRLKYVLVFALGFAVLPAIQLVYWKIYTGAFFYYSYTNPGEGFEFAHPHTLDFLFSFRKGWFVYTPLMLPAVLFLFLGRQPQRDYWLPFVLFTLCTIYVLSCWSNWWYATSFGQRAMIQSYPVYLFGLGILFEKIRTRKMLYITSTVLATLFCALNLFQAWQLRQGILDPSRMTKAAYFAIFGQTSAPAGLNNLLLVDRSVILADSLPQAAHYHETSHRTMPPDSASMFTIQPNQTHSPKIFRLPYRQLVSQDHAWIEISLAVYTLDSTKREGLRLSSCFLNKREQAYQWTSVPVYEKAKAQHHGWAFFKVYYLTPEVRLLNDQFNCQFENTNGGRYLVRDFRIRVFEPRKN